MESISKGIMKRDVGFSESKFEIKTRISKMSNVDSERLSNSSENNPM